MTEQVKSKRSVVLLFVAVAAVLGAAVWGLTLIVHPGWTVRFYSDADFQHQVGSSHARELNFHLPEGVLHYRAIEWHGQVEVPATDDYIFYAQYDGSFRLLIDGQPVIDLWQERKRFKDPGAKVTVALEAGPHEIRAHYLMATPVPRCKVIWTGGPLPDRSQLGEPYVTTR